MEKILSLHYDPLMFDDQYKKKLLSSIPIVQGMGVDFEYKNECVHVHAPVSKHINYEGTAFGGSINTVCLLSCYLMARVILDEIGIQSYSLVIQDSQIKYLQPIASDFVSRSHKPNKEGLLKIERSMSKKGVARISLNSEVQGADGELLVKFNGRFVVKSV